MKKFLLIVLVGMAIGCTSNSSITGQYKAVDSKSIIKEISFDGNVATFKGGMLSLMPSMEYEIKDHKIYVKSTEGILVFSIIDPDTIECQSSIFEGERFKK